MKRLKLPLQHDYLIIEMLGEGFSPKEIATKLGRKSIHGVTDRIVTLRAINNCRTTIQLVAKFVLEQRSETINKFKRDVLPALFDAVTNYSGNVVVQLPDGVTSNHSNIRGF